MFKKLFITLLLVTANLQFASELPRCCTPTPNDSESTGYQAQESTTTSETGTSAPKPTPTKLGEQDYLVSKMAKTVRQMEHNARSQAGIAAAKAKQEEAQQAKNA